MVHRCANMSCHACTCMPIPCVFMCHMCLCAALVSPTQLAIHTRVMRHNSHECRQHNSQFTRGPTTMSTQTYSLTYIDIHAHTHIHTDMQQETTYTQTSNNKQDINDMQDINDTQQHINSMQQQTRHQQHATTNISKTSSTSQTCNNKLHTQRHAIRKKDMTDTQWYLCLLLHVFVYVFVVARLWCAATRNRDITDTHAMIHTCTTCSKKVACLRSKTCNNKTHWLTRTYTHTHRHATSKDVQQDTRNHRRATTNYIHKDMQ